MYIYIYKYMHVRINVFANIQTYGIGLLEIFDIFNNS